MFLGWYDADKKKSPEQKVDEAIERYREKFGSRPKTILTSIADAKALGDVYDVDIPVRGVEFISRSTFYVGVEG